MPAAPYTGFAGGAIDELAYAVLLAGGDDVVLRLSLLQPQPLHLHVVAGVTPVTFGIEVAEVEAILKCQLDARQGTGDLAK